MSPSSLHPKWWQLYLTFPLLIVLFVLESRIRISNGGHQVVQISILLIVYGLILLWLKANRSALMGGDQKRSFKVYRVIEIPPVGSPELEGEKKSMLQLSDSEIHGLLGYGMEMSYTDPELFSYKEICKN